MMQHYSVLKHEAIKSLQIQPNGTYIDGTFGAGGHSKCILSKLDTGSLYGFDQDQLVKNSVKNIICSDNFKFVHTNFKHIKSVAKAENIYQKVDGILFDFGVSSMQIDTPDRGFSFNHDGPLDMRMNQEQTYTAKDFVTNKSAAEMAAIFKDFGEERHSKKIANAIVEYRNIQPLNTTKQLAKLCIDNIPYVNKHPATRVFQAIRIYVNAELEIIKQTLLDSFDVLANNGTLIVISFHSLEDKIVKQVFAELTKKSSKTPWPLPQQYTKPPAEYIVKKLKPSLAEVKINPRSKSAILRGIKKCQ